MTGVLIRREDTQRNREGHVKTERDPSDLTAGRGTNAKDHWKPPTARKRQGRNFPSSLQGKDGPADALISDVQLPKL